MFQKLLRSVRLLERSREKGFFKTLAQSLYSVQDAVPTFLDLADLKPEKHPLGQFSCEIRLITIANQVEGLQFPVKSRRLQVKTNLRKGYKMFALIKQGRMIGDIWFTQVDDKRRAPHRDLKIFKMDLGPSEAYAFDLYVLKEERGKDLTTSFMTNALREMRALGLTRVYGCYMAKNVPALWIHRLIGYKELPRVKVRNFLGYRTAVRPRHSSVKSAF